MTKGELRIKYKEKRNALSFVQREELSLSIANQALQMPIWDESYYHLYLPIHSQAEINTEHLLSILSGKDKNIVISSTETISRTLKHYLLTDNTVLKTNKWGIPEPQDGLPVPENLLDVVFVPLLCVDHKGNRLGYGKGYYDTFLQECRPDCLKIGLSFFYPVAHVPAEDHDVALNACITADEIIYF